MGKYRYNRYRDVEIDISRLEFSTEAEFCEVIKQEHDKWYSKLRYPRIQDVAVMWLNVPKNLTWVVPSLLAMSPPFIMHHANAQRIMLVRQANPRAGYRCQIPSYGTHYVKVECVVIEENTDRILMVKERIGSDSIFKLVTGSTDAGEFVSNSAEREVWEEARIRCKAVSLLGCGNRIRTRFDRDEIIMGVLLIAPEGQCPRADGYEVRNAMWCNISDATVHCSPMSREWLTAALISKGKGILPRVHTIDIFRGEPYNMDFYIPI